MKTYKIGIVAGDGIGPEVVREGLKVLNALAAVEKFKYELIEYPWGSERYLKTGEACPANVLDEYRKLDAILLGAIGDPRCPTGLVEHAVIMTMRVGLDLYVNLRPITLYAEHLCPLKNKRPEDVDMIVCRENTEDAYTGPWGLTKKGTPDEIATSLMLYTRKGTERIIRYAFETCRTRNKRKKLTMVDKANAVRAHDLWTRTFEEVGREYPDIEKDHAYVDATCMWFVKNPEWFDVIVSTNLFGDIITDLGAMIQGGMGIAASGNLHPGQVSMFEPIHGSAPKYAGQNVANPLATVNAVGMMLDYLGEKSAAARVDQAVRTLLVSRRIPSVEARSGLSTSEIGDMVAKQVS
jgi:3-isopropylmalate dehydrogenase